MENRETIKYVSDQAKYGRSLKQEQREGHKSFFIGHAAAIIVMVEVMIGNTDRVKSQQSRYNRCIFFVVQSNRHNASSQTHTASLGQPPPEIHDPTLWFHPTCHRITGPILTFYACVCVLPTCQRCWSRDNVQQAGHNQPKTTLKFPYFKIVCCLLCSHSGHAILLFFHISDTKNKSQLKWFLVLLFTMCLMISRPKDMPLVLWIHFW